MGFNLNHVNRNPGFPVKVFPASSPHLKTGNHFLPMDLQIRTLTDKQLHAVHFARFSQRDVSIYHHRNILDDRRPFYGLSVLPDITIGFNDQIL